MREYTNYEYEIIWKSGYVENITACQISWPNNALRFGLFQEADSDAPDMVHFHAMLDGQWVLVLSADGAEIETIRNVSAARGLLYGEEE